MKQLVITCRFVAHSYQGRRSSIGKRDELEWPPSPGRLHQALMSAALTGRHSVDPAVRDHLDALCWMEHLSAPEIVATRLLEGARSRARVAIPQNNPVGSDYGSHSTLLAPNDKAVPINDEFSVSFVWALADSKLEQSAETYREALTELVAQMSYLGRAEDRVEVSLEITNSSMSSARELPSSERWQPCEGRGDVELWLPKPLTTERLIRRHSEGAKSRERKEDAQRHLRSQGYSTHRAHARLPIAVSIFQLFPDNDDPDVSPISLDAENSGRWRSPMRELAINAARNRDYWDDPELALELISGHARGNSSRSEQPHLAFVPLPSVTASGKADGRVRRMALVGFAKPEVTSSARDIYATLAAALDGQMLDLNGLQARLRLVDKPADQDPIWRHLVGVSHVWSTLTPVAFARGFKIPTMTPDGSRALTSNERYRRKLAEWTALLRDSLRHAGLPERLIISCDIRLTSSPLISATVRAERYRASKDNTVVSHAVIEFTEPIRGPVLIGDRRYQGLGLFMPMSSNFTR